MEKETLDKIRAKLADGDVKLIANATNRSKGAVYQVFRKESFVAGVLDESLNQIERNAYESLQFVKEMRKELKKSVEAYERKKFKQIQKPISKQQQQAA